MTATNREFKKPNKSEMGEEVTFDPEEITGYTVSVSGFSAQIIRF